MIQMLHTLSTLFCQLSSLFTIRSMQWDRVARIPAVVALNVMASPLKSIPLIPLGVKAWNTARKKSIIIHNFDCCLCSHECFRLERKRVFWGCGCATHIFLCCHCCCAETLHLCGCWGSHLHHPPRLKKENESQRGEANTKSTKQVVATHKPFLVGPY